MTRNAATLGHSQQSAHLLLSTIDGLTHSLPETTGRASSRGPGSRVVVGWFVKAPVSMLDKMRTDETFVLRELKQLKDEVAEVAKKFPTIKAVCYKLEDRTVYVDFYAPEMKAEEHFELTEAMLRVEDSLAIIDVDYHTTCLALSGYKRSGFDVVRLRREQR